MTRPFEGLPGEADWVAMRELVPSATATLRTTDGRDVTLASVLPGGAPALVRANGEILLGVQLQASSDDVSRDIGTALAAALDAPAGAPVDPGPVGAAGSAGPRLQELLDAAAPLEVTVHDDFGFWLEGVEPGAAAQAGLQHANEAILPTVRLEGLDAAYWVRPGDERAHLRWVRPEPEEKLLDALARLRGVGADPARRGHPLRRARSGRTASSSRCGTCPPTSRRRTGSRPRPRSSRGWSRRWPSTEPLTADERRARAGLFSRQITLR